MSKRIELVINYYNQKPEIIRIKELENYIDKNEEIKELFSTLKAKQRQLVNAKEYRQEKQYVEYLIEYESIYNKLMDYPFVEEYLGLVEMINNDLLIDCRKIEKNIDDVINNKN